MLIIVLVAKTVYLVSLPVEIVMKTIAPSFQKLKLWTIQKIKVVKGLTSNYLICNDMSKY